MEDQVDRLVAKLQSRILELKENERYMLSISGIPGSGKTTLAKEVVDRINACQPRKNSASPAVAVSLSMDGYHMTRAELSAMPNAAEAHERRGAPWTFNVHKLMDVLSDIKKSAGAVYAASFDHAVKDPVEEDILIAPENQLVVVEGLYLSLDQDVWRDTTKIFDESWFVDVGRELAVERVIERHLRAGIADTREDADKRARGSDYLNADLILANRLPVDEVIKSVEDNKWKGGPVDEVLEN